MCLGVPKATFSLSDLLEGITELRKAVILMVVVCYSKRIQNSVSNKNRRTGSSRQQAYTFSLISPSEDAWAVFYSPSNDELRPYGILLPRQGHLVILLDDGEYPDDEASSDIT